MNNRQTKTEQNLRQRAEETVRKGAPSAQETLTPEEMKQMLHEHRVHLVELELQNEELQTTQEELAVSLARYFDFYNMAPVAYFTVDENGLILEANDTAATMLGEATGALIKQPFNRFILKDDQDIYYLHCTQLFAIHSEDSTSSLRQGQAANTCELRMMKMDGSVFWGHLLTTVSQATDGLLVSRIVLSDIADRKQLETGTQDALEYSENIVETVRESLVVLDSGLKILTANSSFYSTFKVTPEETIGNFIYDLGNRQWDIPRLRLLLEEILPQKNFFNDYEVDHVFQSIGRKTILLNARQIFRNDIGSLIILLAMEDITERKNAENEREAALARVKKLEGIIPICMHCKKIRDDQNSWNQLEEYITNHSEAMFSHGICPQCYSDQMEIIAKMAQ
jgi:PAS domain S-box-containing protein